METGGDGGTTWSAAHQLATPGLHVTPSFCAGVGVCVCVSVCVCECVLGGETERGSTSCAVSVQQQKSVNVCVWKKGGDERCEV